MSFIPPVVIPTPNALTNPLRSNLDAGNYAITTASRVTGTTTETNTVTTVPGSAALGVEFQSDIRVAGAKGVEFLGAGIPNKGHIVADPAVGLFVSGLRSGSQTQVLGYNATSKEVVVQPAGGGSSGISNIVAGSNIHVDASNPAAPIVAVAIDAALDMNGQDIADAGSVDVASLNAAAVTLTGPLTASGSAGTVGDYLVSGGAGAAPVWTAPPVVVADVVAGTNISVDGADPTAPVIGVDIKEDLQMNGFQVVGAGTITATGITLNDGATLTSSLGQPLSVDSEVIADGLNLNTTVLFKDAREFYVSKDGSDSNNGSANAPFASVARAVTVAEGVGSPSIIRVAPGTYVEDLSITRGYVTIMGGAPCDVAIGGPVLKGIISVAVTGADNLHNNQVVFSGVSISGTLVDTSTAAHTLLVQDCRVETGTGATDSSAIAVSGTAADQRTYVFSSRLSQNAAAATTSPLIACALGRLHVDSCTLTVRVAASSVIGVSGAATLSQLTQSTCEQDAVAATLAALVSIDSTSTTAHNIALSSFAVGSSTAKVSAPAIAFVRPAVAAVVNSFFAIQGTSPSTAVITGPAGTVVQVAGNRAATGTAAALGAGITGVPAAQVGETTVTSVAAGSGIGVSAASGAVTISNTGVTGLTAGSGIGVSASSGSVTVSNAGVLELTAGTNIAITGSKSNYTISATAPPSSGVTSLNTETGAVTIGGGSGISVGTSAGAITVSNTGVTGITAGSGIAVTGSGAVTVANDGVLDLTAGSNVTITGSKSNYTIAAANPGVPSVNSITSAVTVAGGSGVGITTAGSTVANSGVLELTAGSNVTITGSKSNYTISASGGGGGGVTSLNNETGAVTIAAGSGISVSTAGGTITVASTAAPPVAPAGVSTAVTLDGFTSLVSAGSIISTSGALPIFEYTETLTSDWVYTSKALGFLGFVSMALTTSHGLVWTAKMAKNGSAYVDVVGTSFFTDGQFVSAPVNCISAMGASPDVYFTYSTGDVVKLKFYAQALNGAATVASPPGLLQAVYAPITNSGPAVAPAGTILFTTATTTTEALYPFESYSFQNGAGQLATVTTYLNGVAVDTLNVAAGGTVGPVTGVNGYTVALVVVPPSGTIDVTSPVTVPSPLEVTNSYRFTNSTGADADLTMYLTAQPTPQGTVLAGATYPPVEAPALTGYDGYTLAPAAPPFPPAGTVTISAFNAPGDPPVGIDPNQEYRFLNSTGGDGLLSLFVNGAFDNQYGLFNGDYYPGGPTATVTGVTGYLLDPL